MKEIGFIFLYLLLSFPVLPQRNTLANSRLNDADILSMAAEQYRLFLSTNVLIDSAGSGRELQIVKKVSDRIIEAVKTYYTQKRQLAVLKGYNWEVNLVDKKEVNAWCMPGGKIVVYTGMMDFAQNEGTLAVVLGHEIAHSLLNHGNERLKMLVREFMGGKSFQEVLAAKPADTKDVFLMAYGIGTGMGKTIGVMPPFSPKNELEADQLGLIFTAMAGYNPREALVAWQRMARMNGTARKPELLSAHPVDDSKRMEEIEAILDDITKNYYKPVNKS
jgi:predicted Zn-dependent protease